MVGGAGLGVFGGVGAAVAAATPAAAQTAPGASNHFDFDTGNAIIEVFIPKTERAILGSVAPMDATMVLRVTTLIQVAWFDAFAPYHPTAVGIHSNLGRRPSSEASTNRNKNIALLYATLRVLNNVLPQHAATWREMLTSVGLNPDDDQQNRETAVGIGNLAGQAVVAARLRDGMNQVGDEGGRKYNLVPYRDYTGYRPVNTAYQLTNPSRWQPGVGAQNRRLGQSRVDGDVGIFVVQQFVTPQMRLTKPYSITSLDPFRAPPPVGSDHRNPVTYRAQVDQVLAASAGLTEKQKLIAELFDDKFLGLGMSVGSAAFSRNLDLDGWVHIHAITALAAFDTAIAIWDNKVRYDAVRPFSAVHHVYGNKPVTAWGGPGKGTVNDLPGNEWQSYLGTGDHSEYPSGSAGFCAAHAEASRRYFGTDELDFSFTYPKGGSRVEPGVTPSQDTTLHWSTWTDFNRDCGLSRNWGGVHFLPSIKAAQDIGEQIGGRAYEFIRRHIDGNVTR